MTTLGLIVPIMSPPFSGSRVAFTATGPVAKGTVMGNIVTTPPGTLTLSGANVKSFSLSGNNLVTAAVLAAGIYDVTVTTT
jgi:hypothetical protein